MSDGEPGSLAPSPVAFLGVGAMGLPMASRLLDAGFPLVVWNRTSKRAGPLAARGARVAETPAEAAREAAIVLLMLTDPAAVAAVTQGNDGVLAGIREGSLLCDLSTVSPDSSRRLAALAAARGAAFVDAPVYGSRKPAEDGTLAVFAGGAAADVARLQPVFAAIGKRTFHAGPVGSGSALKLAVNLVGAHLITGLATGIALARRSGVDGELFLDALGAGAFTSPLVEIKGHRMVAGKHEPPGFTVDLTRKDLGLIFAALSDLGLETAVLEAVDALYARAQARGLGGSDLSAVVEVLGREDGPPDGKR